VATKLALAQSDSLTRIGKKGTSQAQEGFTLRSIDLAARSSKWTPLASQSDTTTHRVVINYPDVSWPDLPFGGIKRSGYGEELSNLSLEEFVNKKLIVVPNVRS